MNRTVDIEESIVGILYSHPKSFAEVIKIAPLIKNPEMRQAIEIAKHAQKEYGQFDPRYTIDRVSEAGENSLTASTLMTLIDSAPSAEPLQLYIKELKQIRRDESLRKEFTILSVAAAEIGTNGTSPQSLIPQMQEMIAKLKDSHNGYAKKCQDKILTYKELMNKEIKPVDFLIDKIIPTGFGLLGGRPKLGKSWLLLQVGIAASSGGIMFNKKTKPVKVLYMALEDSERRLYNRLKAQLTDNKLGDIPLHFVFDPILPPKLDSWINEDDYGLVIIDTISRYFKNIITDHNDQAKTTAAFSQLHDLTRKNEITIIGCEHHRKPGLKGRDLVDDIIGSTGKGAVADFVIGLYRDRGQFGATLTIDGRDTEEYRELKINFDTASKSWQLVGDDILSGEKGLRKVCLDVVNKLSQGSAGEIAKHTNRDKENVRKVLNELATEGKLLRDSNGKKGRNSRVVFKTLGNQR